MLPKVEDGLVSCHLVLLFSFLFEFVHSPCPLERAVHALLCHLPNRAAAVLETVYFTSEVPQRSH